MIVDSSNSHRVVEEPVDTIGSRLRKRRRTDSLPADEVLGLSQLGASKRSSLRKTTSPVSRRVSPDTRRCVTGTSSQDTVSASPEETKDEATNTSESRLQLVLNRQNSASKHVTPPLLPIPSPSLQLLSSDHEAALLESQKEQNMETSSASDMVALMMSIVDRGERIDSARSLDSDYNVMDVDGLPTWGSSVHLKAQSLPILDNLVRAVLSRYLNY